MARDQYTFTNPVELYSEIEPRKGHQEEPGLDADLAPKADLGEDTYRGTGRLTGRKALITGGDSGIGAATAIAFAREGADVAIAYYNEHDDARETVRWVRDAGRRALAFDGDLREREHCRDVVERTAAEFGRLDILVNNAGIETRTSILDTTEDQYDRVMSVNLKSAFFATQIAARQMIKQGGGGRIINITSVHEDWPMPGNTAYCLSKGGMRMLTRTAGVELAPHDILVVGVGPGAVATPINTSTMNDPAKLAKPGKGLLDIAVSKASVPRASRIMQALFSAFERRGFAVRVSENGETVVAVLDEPFQIALIERLNQLATIVGTKTAGRVVAGSGLKVGHGYRVALPVAVAVAGAGHGIALDGLLNAYLHALAANLVSAGVRLVPLGQTDGQRVLAALEPGVRSTAERALAARLDDVGAASFRADLASMRHETQYTRLFRS